MIAPAFRSDERFTQRQFRRWVDQRPSTAKRDQTERKDLYARNGVHEYWIVDPHRRTVAVYALKKRAYGPGRTYGRGTVRSRVLPKLRFEVETLFAL